MRDKWNMENPERNVHTCLPVHEQFWVCMHSKQHKGGVLLWKTVVTSFIILK